MPIRVEVYLYDSNTYSFTFSFLKEGDMPHCRIRPLALMLLATSLVLTSLWAPRPGQAQAPQTVSRTFPQTGKTVSGKFLEYWLIHGGLPQQGFPISSELNEVSDTNGKAYTVQYFERAVFESSVATNQ